MNMEPPVDSLSGLGAFADPVRRQLYEYVVSRQEPVTRADAAASVGISRSLAAYHLDHLVEAGLLTFRYARDAGRGGPGAGRPAKRYTRAAEVSITIPARRYGLLASLLAEAVAADASARLPLYEAAAEEGRRAAAEAPDTIAALAARGYEPAVSDDGDIVMNNCPFYQVAQQQPELVCTLNHHLLRGYLDGKGDDPDQAELSPCEGRCCVVIHPSSHEEPETEGRGTQGREKRE
jgi:predicted ArsR family transcriptional regulator